MYLALQFVVVLYFGKSAVNPFIFGWKNQDLRASFLRVLKLDHESHCCDDPDEVQHRAQLSKTSLFDSSVAMANMGSVRAVRKHQEEFDGAVAAKGDGKVPGPSSGAVEKTCGVERPT